MVEEREVWHSRLVKNQGLSENYSALSDGSDTLFQWNFEKFLIDKEGKVVGRWASTTTPASIESEVEKIL